LLAALAACGRIGYEGRVSVDEQDGPIITPDAGTDGSQQVDQQVPGLDLGSEAAAETAGEVMPDVVMPDVVTPDMVMPDMVSPDVPDAFTSPDATVPGDGPSPMEAPPRDVGVDAPTARIVVATGQNPTPRRGANGAGTVDTCPDGSLLVGYEGTQSTSQNAFVQSMVGVCATVTFPLPGAPATPWQLTRLPARGDTSGERWSRLCPTGHVLVGFDGNAGSRIGQIVFACAPIALSSSGQAVLLGSDIELDDVGAATGSDFPQTDCPAGQAARGAETRSGTALEAFGLICATMVLR
jgi:hypothetical protein